MSAGALKSIQGSSVKGKGLKIGVTVSRFHSQITDRLLDGALDALKTADVASRRIFVVSVPGAFELPIAAKKLAHAKKPDAVICLGAIIRGETEHFTYVCKAAQEGIVAVSLELELPVTFAVLTTENWQQAMVRAQPGPGNKGYQAARDAVELANLFRMIR